MAGGRGKGAVTPTLRRLVRRGRRVLAAKLRSARPSRHVKPEVYHVWAAVRPHAWARLYLQLGPSRPRSNCKVRLRVHLLECNN